MQAQGLIPGDGNCPAHSTRLIVDLHVADARLLEEVRTIMGAGADVRGVGPRLAEAGASRCSGKDRATGGKQDLTKAGRWIKRIVFPFMNYGVASVAEGWDETPALAAHVLHLHDGFRFTQEANNLLFGKKASSRPISFSWGLDSEPARYSNLGGHR